MSVISIFSRMQFTAFLALLVLSLPLKAEIIQFTFDDNTYLSGTYTYDDVLDYVTSFDVEVLVNNDPVTTRENNNSNLPDIEAGNFTASVIESHGGERWSVYIFTGRPFPPTNVLASVSAVPEPATYLMMMAGLILLLTLKAKRQKL